MAKKAKESVELSTPSVLAFERKLDPSDGLFCAGVWDDRKNGSSWRKLGLVAKSVRGTISNRLKGKDSSDPAKLDAKVEKPNLQTVDVCVLPSDCDTLRVKFTLKILGGVGVPSACNVMGYKAKLQETVEGYKKAHGFSDLSRRYAYNLANGRFLWRNRFGAENLEVSIARLLKGKSIQTWTFDPTKWPLREFGAIEKGVEELASVIDKGLRGEEYVLLEVIAHARLGEGQEVFPSQELILDKESSGKSKTLYSLDDVAGLHSQKIGNAIRTIDTWYADAAEYGPIPIEPYGSVTTQGTAFRKPIDKRDFYTLLDNWILRDQAPSVDDQHFVMANLIRGGVFGEAEKNKD